MSARPGDRGRGAGAGDLHADARFPARLRAFVAKAEPRFEGELSGHDRRSFLSWPFFEPRHRDATREQLESWAADTSPVDHRRRRCRLPRAGGRLGQRRLAGADGAAAGAWRSALDVRTLCAVARDARPPRRPRGFRVRHAGARRRSDHAVRHDRAARMACANPRRNGHRRLRPDRAALRLGRRRHRPRRPGATATAGVLDGEKTWISNGGIADVYVVFARTGEAPGAKGLSAFIVPAATPGLEIVGTARGRSRRIRWPGCPSTACRVPASALIGAAGDGFSIAMAMLDVFRSTVGAAALGFARRALDESGGARAKRARAVRRAAGRAADGAGPPRRHGARHRRRGAARLPRRLDQGQGAARVTREAAMAKLYATERAQRVIDRAVQLHGGDGVRARPRRRAALPRDPGACASTKAPPTCRGSSSRAQSWRDGAVRMHERNVRSARARTSTRLPATICRRRTSGRSSCSSRSFTIPSASMSRWS